MRPICGLFLMFGMMVCGYAQSQPPPPSETKGEQAPQQQTQKNQEPSGIVERGSENSPVVVRLLNPPHQNYPAAPATQKAEDKSAEWGMFWITFGLLIIAGAQLVYFIRQLGIMKITIVDAQIAANAATKAADATERSVKLAERTAKKQLRAYLVFDHQNIGALPPNSFFFRIINCGQTPAYDVQVSIDHREFPGDFYWPKEDLPKVSWESTPGSRHPLAAGGERRCEMPMTGFDNYSDLVKAVGESNAGRISLYYFGQVEYRDVFNDRHTADFCVRHRPGMPWNVYYVHGEHNGVSGDEPGNA